MIGESDLGFKTHPEWTIPTILIHLALTLSSVQFKIPAKRIKSGDRIWPEYRLHHLCFSSRTLATISLYSYERYYNLPPNYDLNFLIMLAGFVAVDLSSLSVGDNHSPTVRGFETHPLTKYLFAYVQFIASAGLMYGVRSCTLPFKILLTVQITPFGATLRRKNIFTSKFWGAFGFGALAILGNVAVFFALRLDGERTLPVVLLLANVAALMRMTPLPAFFRPIQSRYVLWTALFLFVRQVRPQIDEIPIAHLVNAIIITALLNVINAIYKWKIGEYREFDKAAGKTL
jgi:hypothetical protein